MVVFVIILAIFFALLQTTVSPSFRVNGGSLDLVLAVLMVLLFFDSKKHAGVFILVSSIFLTIFSTSSDPGTKML